MSFAKLLPAIFTFAIFIVSALPAQARIDIVPQKIVMEPRDRSAEITILNLSDTPGTYRVDVVHYLQDNEGRYIASEQSVTPPFDPAQHVRYSPRQFTLPSNGRQKIRISLRKPADLPDGEYRFHVKTLHFGAAPADAEAGDDQDSQTVTLTMNMGITIPVVIRHGDINVDAQLDNIRLLDASQTDSGRPQLQATIRREGNASALCIVRVLWEPEGGREREIGYIRNLNVFTESDHRNFSLNLTEAPQGNGTMRIELLDEETLELFDEAILR